MPACAWWRRSCARTSTLYRDLGRIEHRPVLFSRAQLEGATLVVAATDDEAVNDAVAVAARERGIWSTWWMMRRAPRSSSRPSSIARRLIVAVGTGGSSPTLARRVRTQIEALLPERLGALAEYAGTLAQDGAGRIAGLPQRLRFWDGFFNGPVAASCWPANARRQTSQCSAALEQARVAAA